MRRGLQVFRRIESAWRQFDRGGWPAILVKWEGYSRLFEPCGRAGGQGDAAAGWRIVAFGIFDRRELLAAIGL